MHIVLPEGVNTINYGETIKAKIIFETAIPCDIGWEFPINHHILGYSGDIVVTNVY